ncbi:MAG TPA: hypothetical protein DCY15_06930 [Ruminococcaceae bacterium]|nr:hypothetical protein [Oscillospiraceae bacterium]
MTKNEFLSEFTEALNKYKIADAEDIIEEYREHFDFKLADGYSEEEIAAKLGKPRDLAAQFVVGSTTGKKEKSSGGKKFLTVFGLCWADLFVGIFFICLIAFEIVIAASILAFLLAAIGLIAGIEPVTEMPLVPSILFAGTLVSLAVVFVGLLVYYTAFMCQVFRSYSRFHHNTLASANGQPVLPSLPINPQITPKCNRRVRNMTLAALTVFIILLIMTVVVSAIMAGSIQFWHAWGWFGYKA